MLLRLSFSLLKFCGKCCLILHAKLWQSHSSQKHVFSAKHPFALPFPCTVYTGPFTPENVQSVPRPLSSPSDQPPPFHSIKKEEGRGGIFNLVPDGGVMPAMSPPPSLPFPYKKRRGCPINWCCVPPPFSFFRSAALCHPFPFEFPYKKVSFNLFQVMGALKKVTAFF